MTALAKLSDEIRQYLIITTNYWAFTLTDGALRMLVVLHFYSLGYSPLQIAMLFLFYEIFGVITNLVGGWLGAHIGLNKTMNIGLLLQVVALSMLLVPSEWLTVIWVMAAQALSGVAKDLNKMSAKSAIKLLVPKEENGQLYKWVAALTGSKNALKGVGFFLGGGLLTLSGFKGAVLVMALGLMMVWIFSLFSLKQELGRAKNKPKFSHVFSKSQSVNVLSAARMFLFGSRDVWFVVALPVYLSTSFGWDHWYVGGFLALWVIGYGAVQGFTPRLTTRSKNRLPDGKDALFWALALSLIPVLIAVALAYSWHKELVLIVGLMIFGVFFAINSALHSYLIVSYAGEDGVSLDVGFYYMANAMGRLIGTVLSGWLYQSYGLGFCLWMSALFIVITAVISLYLPKHKRASASI